MMFFWGNILFFIKWKIKKKICLLIEQLRVNRLLQLANSAQLEAFSLAKVSPDRDWDDDDDFGWRVRRKVQ